MSVKEVEKEIKEEVKQENKKLEKNLKNEENTAIVKKDDETNVIQNFEPVKKEKKSVLSILGILVFIIIAIFIIAFLIFYRLQCFKPKYGLWCTY